MNHKIALCLSGFLFISSLCQARDFDRIKEKTITENIPYSTSTLTGMIDSIVEKRLSEKKISETNEKPDFSFLPMGRIFFDGGLFFPAKDGFKDGVTIPDIRLGGAFKYKKFTANIMIGYGMGTLSAKDIFLNYKVDSKNSLRLGYFIHQYGLNAAYFSSLKATMHNPISDSFFKTTGFNLGLRYEYDYKDAFIAASVFTSPSGLKMTPAQRGKMNIGMMERAVWRPLHSSGKIAQIGLSAWYETAEHSVQTSDDGRPTTSTGYFNYSANFPTMVNNVTLLKANVTNAKGVVKLSPELLLSKGRLALESQYFYMNVARENGFNNYRAHGVYGILRGLILGDHEYGYSNSNGGLALPSPKSLECVLGFDYTNASDHKAGILGGISNDYSLTLNYYLNKYIVC
ncbi:MAG: hypothetical protein K2N05_12960, partial [Muribaculaceae bacterium]|nr:hypothetical protein [Muribaculaceae bacterium]